ncbi:oxidoreductase [Adhaeribacter aerolatus]|uniref:Oxidoreductase n=1 Tax=Adhaeribacter aerolatus TaxID=670289 RepID=A0A512AXI3_9BACT|nr:Gfo/Idh/MocA family oxidoreductase [Adhaeribacter aerolatus]GEO04431.1 oxidoreductase [Adhaeribacter aerolatus]
MIPPLPLPQTRQPILIIGAGGIVKDAHLPAYQSANFPVAGIFDLNQEKAQNLASAFNIPQVYGSLLELIVQAPPKAIFDIALPASEILATLRLIPDGSACLIQKPMGEDLTQAEEILQLCRAKKLVAGINFQLRYAPAILAARHLLNQGLLGELVDIEINVNVYTPWHLWDFLFKLPRTEILYHSIHYVDLVRSFLGNPQGIYAKATKHPHMSQLASVRSNIIMDYGDTVRANILTNHCHQFGLTNQQSYIKLEGTKGAVKMKLGLLMDYPKGVPDAFEYVVLEPNQEPQWQTMAIIGSWFPHAFIGSMAQVMLAAEGSIAQPDNSVEDCIYTMACVEAAYDSSKQGGISISNKF